MYSVYFSKYFNCCYEKDSIRLVVSDMSQYKDQSGLVLDITGVNLIAYHLQLY